MESVYISSWDDLQSELFTDQWHAYRGMSSADHDRELSTSLVRLGHEPREMERHLLRNFKKYARQQVDADSVWHWLSVAQHHGLPTRLLDWTYSPLVAAHFATDSMDNLDEDGVIWTVDASKVNRLLPDPLRETLEEEGAHVFTTQLLAGEVEHRADLEDLSAEPFPLFFEPPSLDERIVNQFALFSLGSDPAMDLEDWLVDHPDLARRILVGADAKVEIRRKLDQANITERVLFPGLDGLSDWLKRYYHPRFA